MKRNGGSGSVWQGWLGGLVVAGVALVVSPFDAQAVDWSFVGTGSPATGVWHEATHWDPAVVPTAAEWVFIKIQGVTAKIVQPGAVCARAYIGYFANTTNRLIVESGDLTVGIDVDVGYLGHGTVMQSGGSIKVTNNINIASAGGGIGIYTQTAGFVQCNNNFFVGASSGSDGTYALSGTGTVNISGNWFSVGHGGRGRFRQEGGRVSCAGTMIAGAGVGAYELAGGLLQCVAQYIGKDVNANGAFTQTGGTNQLTSSQHMYIGAAAGATGTYTLAGGTLLLTNGAQVYVGHSGGTATFILNTNSSGTAAIVGNTAIHVGNSHDNITGTFRGFGVVASQPVNSGRVIADGYGADRTLEFTGTAGLYNDYDNGTSESNGWFAQSGGKLVLPGPTVYEAPVVHYWGETDGPDMINAVRIDMNAGHGSGTVTGALLAPDRTDTQLTDSLVKIIGLWDLSAPFATGGTLTFRYDHTAAARLGISDEAQLKVFHLSAGEWSDVTASVNTTLKTITTKSLTTLGKFAVCRPATGTLVIMK